MSNASEQKQWLFTTSEHRYPQDQWKELGHDIKHDELQVKRMLF